MPKSYLSEEPGALQGPIIASTRMHKRGTEFVFYRMGHPVEKIEFIILGARGPLTRVRTRCTSSPDALKP